jgi:hypothetical protein
LTICWFKKIWLALPVILILQSCNVSSYYFKKRLSHPAETVEVIQVSDLHKKKETDLAKQTDTICLKPVPVTENNLVSSETIQTNKLSEPSLKKSGCITLQIVPEKTKHRIIKRVKNNNIGFYIALILLGILLILVCVLIGMVIYLLCVWIFALNMVFILQLLLVIIVSILALAIMYGFLFLWLAIADVRDHKAATNSNSTGQLHSPSPQVAAKKESGISSLKNKPSAPSENGATFVMILFLILLLGILVFAGFGMYSIGVWAFALEIALLWQILIFIAAISLASSVLSGLLYLWFMLLYSYSHGRATRSTPYYPK